jgi:V-type H+-transporting ATPase subunit E
VRSSGGVKLISGSRRITLDNTLDERLRLLEDRVRYAGVDDSLVLMSFVQMLPEIRYDLFGPNENRKFYT